MDWPEETWDMKLGKAVRNIRCGHNYKDKQSDLKKLGFDFKISKDINIIDTGALTTVVAVDPSTVTITAAVTTNNNATVVTTNAAAAAVAVTVSLPVSHSLIGSPNGSINSGPSSGIGISAGITGSGSGTLPPSLSLSAEATTAIFQESGVLDPPPAL